MPKVVAAAAGGGGREEGLIVIVNNRDFAPFGSTVPAILQSRPRRRRSVSFDYLSLVQNALISQAETAAGGARRRFGWLLNCQRCALHWW